MYQGFHYDFKLLDREKKFFMFISARGGGAGGAADPLSEKE